MSLPVEPHLLEMMIGWGIKRGGDTPASPHSRGAAKRISPAESSPACYNDPIMPELLFHTIMVMTFVLSPPIVFHDCGDWNPTGCLCWLEKDPDAGSANKVIYLESPVILYKGFCLVFLKVLAVLARSQQWSLARSVPWGLRLCYVWLEYLPLAMKGQHEWLMTRKGHGMVG